MLTTYRALLAAYFGFAAATIIWDISAAGRLVYDRRAPKVMATITALGALLLVPGVIVSVSSASIVDGRAIQPVAILWPVVAVLFAVQALIALGRRLVHPLFGIPVLAYDVIIATVAVARWLSSRGAEPPQFALVLSAAQASALSVVGGSAALARATWPLVPLFSPALPSRSRMKRLVRTVLATGVTAAAALVIVEVPEAVEAIQSYRRYEHDTLQERPEGDLTFGLKVFPELRGAPPPVAITNDLALADSLGVDAIDVVVDPEAARGRALDSLAHVLDNLRQDSTTIIVTLGYPAEARTAMRRSKAAYVEARLEDVDRLTRALQPAIFLPAYEPYGEGARMLGVQPPEFWIDYIRRAAVVAHHVNPNIRVGVAAASYGSRDSVLYAWAAGRRAPVDIVGFSLMPGFDGATSLDTHMRIARRWLQLYAHPKPHWIWAAGGYPIAHGEESQLLALRGVLSWATQQEQIHGVVLADAGDYDAQRGLRGSNQRFRPALREALRIINSVRESEGQ